MDNINTTAEKIVEITAIKLEAYRIAEANIIGKPGWYDESRDIRDTLQAECVNDIAAEIRNALQAERERIIELVEGEKVSDRPADAFMDYSPHDINSRLDDIIEAIKGESGE